MHALLDLRDVSDTPCPSSLSGRLQMSKDKYTKGDGKLLM